MLTNLFWMSPGKNNKIGKEEKNAKFVLKYVKIDGRNWSNLRFYNSPDFCVVYTLCKFMEDSVPWNWFCPVWVPGQEAVLVLLGQCDRPAMACRLLARWGQSGQLIWVRCRCTSHHQCEVCWAGGSFCSWLSCSSPCSRGQLSCLFWPLYVCWVEYNFL